MSPITVVSLMQIRVSEARELLFAARLAPWSKKGDKLKIIEIRLIRIIVKFQRFSFKDEQTAVGYVFLSRTINIYLFTKILFLVCIDRHYYQPAVDDE